MRIAIVDDDRAWCRSLSLILGGRGHEVSCLGRIAEAESRLAEGHWPDLLIVDYLLPDGTGTELLARLGKELPEDCRVVMVSGHMQDDEAREAMRAVDGKLYARYPKPLELETLFDLLGEVEGNNG